MASPAAGRDVPNAPPRDDSERPEPSHPEPACQEAQKWIEAVTGKSFGDKDFRSGLENGILLCELLSAIKPGLIKKINRLPTPIAGLDNLSVFLRGCEELGLRGAQLFDPGDLQDTSIRANFKDSDCNRKLKNVLNTVFWLGKAASGCASYTGPSLNLKEFEGLLAQMKVDSEEGGESPQKRSVRDSGYDCWDSERSESLSPPRHTRDNSLDSLDSFGSRSQHSPSPDVVNRGNSDGRGSDSEADAPGRRPDVRKDDMLARRTASSDSRSSIPFNQFLPNRANASSYIPAPRRKAHAEEGEQRRSVSMGDMLNEEEVGYLPPMSQSRHERMHEQYNSFMEDEEHWQDDLARWKIRRRSASHELIRKEEERKRMEKRMKEEGGDANKRKSIKTYKEIVEDKERREAELCEAYRNAATPEEAAMVLQRYALRFTISDATLDSLKLPRSTANPNKDPNHVAEEHKTSAVICSETSAPLHKPEPASKTDQIHTKPEEAEKGSVARQLTSESASSGPPTPCFPLSPVTNNIAPQSLQLQSKTAESADAQPEQPITVDVRPPSRQTLSQTAQAWPDTTQPAHTLPSPQSGSCRPVPLLAAKPYCQPRTLQSGHKPVKMDGLVRVNGEVMEEVSVSAPAASAQHVTQEIRDASSSKKEEEVPSEQTAANQEAVKQTPLHQEEEPAKPLQKEEQKPSSGTEVQIPRPQREEQTEPVQTEEQRPPLPTEEQSLPQQREEQTKPLQKEEQTPVLQQEEQKAFPQIQEQTPPAQRKDNTPPLQKEEQTPPRQTENVSTFSGSAISSLIGGRNCVITTTIVTELTQTRVEPHHPDIQTNGQVNGSSVSERPAEEEREAQAATSPNSAKDSSPSVSEVLDESSVTEQYRREQEKLKKEWERAQLEVEEEERKHNEEERRILEETVTPFTPAGFLHQPPGQTVTTPSPPGKDEAGRGNADVQKDSQRFPAENEEQHASKLHFFQDSAGDGKPLKKQELWKTASLDRNPQLNQAHIVKRSESHDAVTGKTQSSASSPQPPSPSRCVSGKRLCSGCSQPLGKGAAMNIDTLGLFFHMQCFKCGVCNRQMGDATTGTDVRIRNGHLSCHECYIATRGRGQPTTL